MEIKQFKVLSTPQKNELFDFIKNTDLTYNKSYVEMIRIYESDTFNYGDTVFILFHQGEIKGSVAIITKEIINVGEAFITDIYVEKKNEEKYLCFLIEEVTKYCSICSARSIKIGIRKNEIQLIPYINKMEFTHIYDAMVMRYRKGENMLSRVKNDMELMPLCISNSLEYMNIHNEAFKNSPNGATIDELEVKDYIVQYANNEELIGICFDKEKPCGIYELSIDGSIGWIDTLAIVPSYQNRELGKSLLLECIKKLYEENLEEVKLLVITSNDVALHLYRGFGFKEEYVFSYWFEKKIKFSEKVLYLDNLHIIMKLDTDT